MKQNDKPQVSADMVAYVTAEARRVAADKDMADEVRRVAAAKMEGVSEHMPPSDDLGGIAFPLHTQVAFAEGEYVFCRRDFLDAVADILGLGSAEGIEGIDLIFETHEYAQAIIRRSDGWRQLMQIPLHGITAVSQVFSLPSPAHRLVINMTIDKFGSVTYTYTFAPNASSLNQVFKLIQHSFTRAVSI